MKPVQAVTTLFVTFIGSTQAVLTIPDSVIPVGTRYTYFRPKGTWYEADRSCKAGGGVLVLVDSQAVSDRLTALSEVIGTSLSHFHTRMVRHDNKSFFTHDPNCKLMSTSGWMWNNANDAYYDPSKQCVLAEGTSHKWIKNPCDHADEYVCEYNDAGNCSFTSSSVSLASVPMANANSQTCRSACLSLIGCYATAPSGHATYAPFTHCLFVVVGDSTNPMDVISCPLQYEMDSTTDAAALFSSPSDPTNDPVDCVPPNPPINNPWGQEPLESLLYSYTNSSPCTDTVVSHISVTETAYVTITPDTIYVTLTPNVVTEFVTTTQEIHPGTVTVTSPIYVTATPSAVTQTDYVTITVQAPTAYVTMEAQIQTAYVTLTPSLTPPCSTEISTVIQTQPLTEVSTHVLTTTVVETPTFCSQPPEPSSVSADRSSDSTTSRTREEVIEEMKPVVRDLKVDAQNVSKTRRAKESATDDRKSAQTIGVSAGLILLSATGVIIMIDLPRIFRDIKNVCPESANRGPSKRRQQLEDVRTQASAEKNG